MGSSFQEIQRRGGQIRTQLSWKSVLLKHLHNNMLLKVCVCVWYFSFCASALLNMWTIIIKDLVYACLAWEELNGQCWFCISRDFKMIEWTDGKEYEEREKVVPAGERCCSNSTGRDDSYRERERDILGLTGLCVCVHACMHVRVCVCVTWLPLSAGSWWGRVRAASSRSLQAERKRTATGSKLRQKRATGDIYTVSCEPGRVICCLAAVFHCLDRCWRTCAKLIPPVNYANDNEATISISSSCCWERLHCSVWFVSAHTHTVLMFSKLWRL